MATENNKTVLWDTLVELQFLFSGSDCLLDRVHSGLGLDVGSLGVLSCQKALNLLDGVIRGDDISDHGCTISVYKVKHGVNYDQIKVAMKRCNQVVSLTNNLVVKSTYPLLASSLFIILLIFHISMCLFSVFALRPSILVSLIM